MARCLHISMSVLLSVLLGLSFDLVRAEEDENTSRNSRSSQVKSDYSELSTERTFFPKTESNEDLLRLSEFWHPETFKGSTLVYVKTDREGKVISVTIGRFMSVDRAKEIESAIRKISFPKNSSPQIRVLQLNQRTAKLCREYYLERFFVGKQ